MNFLRPETNMKRWWNEPDGFLEGRGLNKLDFAPRGSRGERRCACSLLWLAGRERTVPSAVLMCEPGADWLRHFELRVDLTTAAESSSRHSFPLNPWHLISLRVLNVFIVRAVTELQRAAPARRLAWIPLTSLNSPSCLPGEERALPHALPSRPPHVVRQPAHERLHIPGERCPPAAQVLSRCAHMLSHRQNTVDWLSDTVCDMKSDSFVEQFCPIRLA